MSKLEKFLNLCADMEAFSQGEDELSALAAEDDDELDENELEWVSAAGRKPDFSAFLEKAREKAKK